MEESDGRDGDSSSSGECEDIVKPGTNKRQDMNVKDLKRASVLTTKDFVKDKDKDRSGTGIGNKPVGGKVKLHLSPNSRANDSLICIKDQLPNFPPEALAKWIEAWTGDVEAIFGCSLEDQSRLANQLHSRCDSIVEAAKWMYEKYKVRDKYGRMADSRMAAMSSRLADLEKKTKHVDDLEKRLITAEKEIALLQRKLEAADGGREKDIPPPTGRVMGLEAIDMASEKLIQTMEQFEERVAEHVTKYVSLRLDPGGDIRARTGIGWHGSG